MILSIYRDENDSAENLLTFQENLLTFFCHSARIGSGPSTYGHKNASKLFNYGQIVKNLSSMES